MDAFIDKWREITSDPEILNIVIVFKIPLRCKPVQSAHLMDAEVESPCKRRYSTSLPHKRGLLPLSIPSPQKGWSLLACKIPGFSKNVRGENFHMENICPLKFLLQRGDFMNTLDIKAHTCRSRPQGLSKVYINKYKQTVYINSLYKQSLYKTNAMPFKACVLVEILFQGFLPNS